MQVRTITVAACALATLVPSSAHAATVTVRVEGESQTRLEQTTATTTGQAFSKTGDPQQTCGGNTVGEALERATAGDWTGPYSQFGYSVYTIKGETHTFSTPKSWFIIRNGRQIEQGACDQPVADGDELLFVPAAYPSIVRYLRIAGPASAVRGESVTVAVTQEQVENDFPSDDNATTPGAGATVRFGAQSATADAQGRATFTATTTGPQPISAIKDGVIRSEQETVVVTAPGEPAPPPAPGGPASSTSPPLVADTLVPTGRIAGLAEQRRYRTGPRVLRGTVSESPLTQVKLRLTRNDRGRCSYFSGPRERFVRMRRCGTRFGRFFPIGSEARWEYQLPSALPRGRYVLEVQAIDRAGNRDALFQRGRNQVVFFVGS